MVPCLLLHTVCHCRLPTDAATDEQLLLEPHLAVRQHAAVVARLEHKMLLGTALELLTAYAASLQ